MGKEIIVVDGSYYKKVGTDLHQIHVVGFEQKTKNCFSDIEPLKIEKLGIEDLHQPKPKPKETRKERRKRLRKQKK